MMTLSDFDEYSVIVNINPDVGALVPELSFKVMKTPDEVREIVHSLIDKGFVKVNPDPKFGDVIYLTSSGRKIQESSSNRKDFRNSIVV